MPLTCSTTSLKLWSLDYLAESTPAVTMHFPVRDHSLQIVDPSRLLVLIL